MAESRVSQRLWLPKGKKMNHTTSDGLANARPDQNLGEDSPPLSAVRRYDLDALRVLAFAGLIFYHIGMFYTTWGWHVKSPHMGPDLEPIMRLMSPWRMSLLFFISGSVLALMAEKMGSAFDPATTAKRRLRLLGLPLVFGIFVIVPPQTYHQLLAVQEIGPDVFSFYLNYISASQEFSVTLPTWNHLWFLVYMLAYTLLALLFWSGIEWAQEQAKRLSGWALAVLPLLALLLIRFTLDEYFPQTHTFIADPATHARYGTAFLAGLVFARSERFCTWTRRAVLPLGAAMVVSAIGLSVLWTQWTGLEPGETLRNTLKAWRVVYTWGMILFLLGAAQRWLNRPSRAFAYLNRGVFSYYVLHQTVIILIAVPLARLGLPMALEFSLVLAGTILICGSAYELVRRTAPRLGVLIGVR